MVEYPPPQRINRPSRSTVVRTPTGKNPGTLKWVLLIFGLLVMALMGLATVAMIGKFNTGWGGLLIGMTMAMLPVPLYVSLAIWIDRFEPEPPLMLALTFLWGATGAVFIAFLINSIGTVIVAKMFGDEAAAFYGPSISAPIVEETAKAMALFAIFFFRRAEFDGVLDGIVYAAMVGLGFAMTENFSYYGKAAHQGAVIGAFTYLLRGVILCFAHPLFTSMTGIGLGIAAGTRSKALKFFAPLAGLGLAMALHSFNNTLVVFFVLLFGKAGALFGLGALCLSIPLLCAGVMTVAGFTLASEGRKIRRYLQLEVATGLFSQRDVDSLCSIKLRMGASFRAWRAAGWAGYRARARFHHVAAELAFFRDRVARGILFQDANAAAQENEFRNALIDLRRQVPLS